MVSDLSASEDSLSNHSSDKSLSPNLSEQHLMTPINLIRIKPKSDIGQSSSTIEIYTKSDKNILDKPIEKADSSYISIKQTLT